jgi:peptidyl-tRNA hydrolase
MYVVAATVKKDHEKPLQRLCEKASGLGLCQASNHEADHSEVNPGFFTAGEHLIVLGEPAPSRKPGEGALNNPVTLPPDAVFCF